jgi:hypothetical protein
VSPRRTIDAAQLRCRWGNSCSMTSTGVNDTDFRQIAVARGARTCQFGLAEAQAQPCRSRLAFLLALPAARRAVSR